MMPFHSSARSSIRFLAFPIIFVTRSLCIVLSSDSDGRRVVSLVTFIANAQGALPKKLTFYIAPETASKKWTIIIVAVYYSSVCLRD